MRKLIVHDKNQERKEKNTRKFPKKLLIKAKRSSKNQFIVKKEQCQQLEGTQMSFMEKKFKNKQSNLKQAMKKSHCKNFWKSEQFLGMQNTLASWISQQTDLGIMVKKIMIIRKAKQIYKNPNFKGSYHWVQNFLSKFPSIKQKVEQSLDHKIKLQQEQTVDIKKYNYQVERPNYGKGPRFGSDVDYYVEQWVIQQLKEGRVPGCVGITRKARQYIFQNLSEEDKRYLNINSSLYLKSKKSQWGSRFLSRHPYLRQKINKCSQNLELSEWKKKINGRYCQGYQEMQNALEKWVHHILNTRTIVKREIQQKARQLYPNPKFKASLKWLDGFLKRKPKLNIRIHQMRLDRVKKIDDQQ